MRFCEKTYNVLFVRNLILKINCCKIHGQSYNSRPLYNEPLEFNGCRIRLFLLHHILLPERKTRSEPEHFTGRGIGHLYGNITERVFSGVSTRLSRRRNPRPGVRWDVKPLRRNFTESIRKPRTLPEPDRHGRSPRDQGQRVETPQEIRGQWTHHLV